jgi:hypothetical protein
MCMTATSAALTPEGWRFHKLSTDQTWGKIYPAQDDWTPERKQEWVKNKADRDRKREQEEADRITALPTLQARHDLLSSNPRKLTPKQNGDLLQRGLGQPEIDSLLSQHVLWQEPGGYGIGAIDPETGLIVGGQIARDDRNPKYKWLLTGETHLPETDQPPLFVVAHPEFNPDQPYRVNFCEGALKPHIAALKMWRSDTQQIWIGAAGGIFQNAALVRAIGPYRGAESWVLWPDAGAVQNPNVTRQYSALQENLGLLGYPLAVAWWGQSVKSESRDCDELTEADAVGVIAWVDYAAIGSEFSAQDEVVEFEEFNLADSVGEATADLYEATAGYNEEQAAIEALRQQCFSDKPESYWLGSGEIFRATGRIRGNIRNGWVAQAIGIGQFLATGTPRDARIVSPIQDLDHQVVLTWVIYLGLKSAGKTPVLASIEAFHTALKAIDASREKTRAKIIREIAANEEAAKQEGKTSEDGSLNPALAKTRPAVLLGDSTIAHLNQALAASDEFTAVSRGLGLKNRMPSAGTLIFSREAVATLRSLGAHNQDATASKSMLSGLWSAEANPVGRKTEAAFLSFKNPVLGMLLACQPDEWYGNVREEAQARVGKTDTGFGIRFLTVPLENTSRDSGEYVPRQTDPEQEEGVRSNVTAHVQDLHQLLQSARWIRLDSEAEANFRDIWHPWINAQQCRGWLDGYKAKASANVLRVAWGFRCMELFDAIALGTRPSGGDIKITGSAMERAIEFCKLTTRSAQHCQATVMEAEGIYQAQKAAEKATSIQNSKWAATFTQPALLMAWVKECQQGGKTQRSAIRSINSSIRRKLKDDLRLDIEAIVSDYWNKT